MDRSDAKWLSILAWGWSVLAVQEKRLWSKRFPVFWVVVSGCLQRANKVSLSLVTLPKREPDGVLVIEEVGGHGCDRKVYMSVCRYIEAWVVWRPECNECLRCFVSAAIDSGRSEKRYLSVKQKYKPGVFRSVAKTRLIQYRWDGTNCLKTDRVLLGHLRCSDLPTYSHQIKVQTSLRESLLWKLILSQTHSLLFVLLHLLIS